MNSVESAVDSFRDAALSPNHWPGALETLARALRADGATLVHLPARPNSVIASTGHEAFLQDYWKCQIEDPRERCNPNVHDGFMTDHNFFTPREIAVDPFYQEFLAPRGLGWHALAALHKDLLICLRRSIRREDFDGEDLGLLNAALPSLRSMSRAASMTWRSGFSGELSAFERFGRGALLLDRRARVLQTNSCVKFGDGLDLSGGWLHAPRPADRSRLQHFLAAVIDEAVTLSLPRARTIALPRPSGLRPWLLDGIACTDAFRSLHSRAAALVLVTDLERPLRPSAHVLHQLFGLTPTESNLACALLAGEPLHKVSQRLAISEAHARQRLKAIFAKTGTSRQAELTALLAKLG